MSAAKNEPRTHKAMREESDRRIIDAAIDAFADRGYHRTTLNQVGEAAGFTGALISNRFGSKAGLLRAVVLHILGRLTPVGWDPSSGDSWIEDDRSAAEQLGEFIDSYVADATERPTRLRALYVLIGESLGGMHEIDAEIAMVNRTFRDHIAGYVRLGQERGEFRPEIDPNQIAVLIVGTLRGVATQFLLESDEFDPAPFAIELRRSLITPLLRDAHR